MELKSNVKFVISSDDKNQLFNHDMIKNQKQPAEVICKKSVLRNFRKLTGKHLCQSLFFNKVAGLCKFIKKETLAQVFSCEFSEISKSTFFTENLSTTASEKSWLKIYHDFKEKLITASSTLEDFVWEVNYFTWEPFQLKLSTLTRGIIQQ